MPSWAPAGREALAIGLVFLVALVALAVVRDRAGPKYRLSERHAIAAAQKNPEVRRFLSASGYTGAESIPLDETMRRVTFFDGPRIVLDAAVDPGGRVRFTQEHRPGQAESGSAVANSPLMLLLLTALFVLATGVWPVRRRRNLDVLALAAFTATVVMINHRLVVASTVVAAVPLVYLIVRCLEVGLGSPRREPPSTPLYEWLTRRRDPAQRQRVLGLVTGATALAFLMITLTSAGESDVATASLSGATELLHGHLPYGNIVEGVVHGDTYPLLTYAFYIPGAALTPVTDVFSDRSGALVVAALASLVAAAGIYQLTRARARETGATSEGELTAGLRGVLAWLAFPPVLLTASGGSNDIVLAACLVWALALAAAAGRSSLLLAAAAWIKVVPLVLAPAWLARLRGRARARALAAAAALTAGLLAWLLLLGGAGALSEMVDGLSFQFKRGSFHSPWRPLGLEWLQLVVQAALAATLAWAALRVRREPARFDDPVRLAGVIGALLLWVQLAANYWTWAYLPWTFPFVAVALLAGSAETSAGPSAAATR